MLVQVLRFLGQIGVPESKTDHGSIHEMVVREGRSWGPSIQDEYGRKLSTLLVSYLFVGCRGLSTPRGPKIMSGHGGSRDSVTDERPDGRTKDRRLRGQFSE